MQPLADMLAMSSAHARRLALAFGLLSVSCASSLTNAVADVSGRPLDAGARAADTIAADTETVFAFDSGFDSDDARADAPEVSTAPDGASADADADADAGAGCPPGYTRCGVDGGCTKLDNDPLNCGACGRECCAGQPCGGGSCFVPCGVGLTACFNSTGTCGACRNLSADSTNCGGCDVQCPAARPTCWQGTCV